MATGGVIGTGISSPAATLINTADAITEKYVQPYLGDVTFIPSPAFWGLTRDGKKMTESELVYGLITQEEMTGGAYFGDQLLDTGVVDSVQPANQIWKFYRQSLSLPVTDVILNRGGMGLDLIKAKFQIASGSLLQKLCRAMWHTSPQNTSLDVDDLDSWVRLTTNTIAGIDRSVAANSWWLPQTNVTVGGVALSQPIAENGYQSTVFGFDEPDLLLMDNTAFAGFKNQFVGLARFTDDIQDKEALQAGFRYHFLYNNAVVMADRFVPNGTAGNRNAYLLNSKYIYPVFNSNDYFTVDPFMKPSNQRVIVSTMYVTWNIMCVGPRMTVAFTGIL